MTTAAPAPAALTFEQGYARLKEITDRLAVNDGSVGVDESCALFAEGKGLEVSLRDYLQTKVGQLDEIEAGNHLPAYQIVAPAPPPPTAPLAG